MNALDVQNETPLYTAIRINNIPAIHTLLDLGADPHIPVRGGASIAARAQAHEFSPEINEIFSAWDRRRQAVSAWSREYYKSGGARRMRRSRRHAPKKSRTSRNAGRKGRKTRKNRRLSRF
jgi:hypothetical protein